MQRPLPGYLKQPRNVVIGKELMCSTIFIEVMIWPLPRRSGAAALFASTPAAPPISVSASIANGARC